MGNLCGREAGRRWGQPRATDRDRRRRRLPRRRFRFRRLYRCEAFRFLFAPRGIGIRASRGRNARLQGEGEAHSGPTAASPAPRATRSILPPLILGRGRNGAGGGDYGKAHVAANAPRAGKRRRGVCGKGRGGRGSARTNLQGRSGKRRSAAPAHSTASSPVADRRLALAPVASSLRGLGSARIKKKTGERRAPGAVPVSARISRRGSCGIGAARPRTRPSRVPAFFQSLSGRARAIRRNLAPPMRRALAIHGNVAPPSVRLRSMGTLRRPRCACNRSALGSALGARSRFLVAITSWRCACGG